MKPDQAFERLRRTLDGSATADERVPCLPVLKSDEWARAAGSHGIVVRNIAPPDGMPDDAPSVAYAVDLGEAVVFVPEDLVPDSMTPGDLHELALDNLRRELTGTATFHAIDGDETESIGQRVLAYRGNYYATEAVLCPEIMREAQRELGADFLAVSMPERGQLLVTDGDADQEVLLQFAIYALCRHHLGDAAHVSEDIFAVKDGELVGHIRGLEQVRTKIAAEAAKHHATTHASVVTRFADRDDEDGTTTLCTVHGSDPETTLRQLEGRLRQWATDNRRDPERTRRIEVTLIVATEEEAEDPELAAACQSLESFLTRQFAQLDAGPHADEPYTVTIRPTARPQPEESLPMSNESAPAPAFTEDEWSLIADAPYIVFLTVAGADGKIDGKEAVAFQSSLVAAAGSTEPTVHRMCTSGLQDPVARLQTLVAQQPDVVDLLQKTGALLDAKLNAEDANKVKVTLVMIGKHIAESSGGGFLGFGKKISKDEKLALAGIIHCLGIELGDRDAA